MKTYLDCIPCFFRQALFAARAAIQDETKIKEVLNKVGLLISEIPLEGSPPETGREVYKIVREVTGVQDPFKALKEDSIRTALDLYPELTKMVKEAKDPLRRAVMLAIMGNVIDFGANPEFRLEQEIERDLVQQPAIDHYQDLRDHIAHAEEILYLGDNAGETVFDRVLIETMGKPVTFVVREAPIINDALREDAVKSGLDKVGTIVSSGCDAPGTVLGTCSPAFVDRFKRADLIISKGQGNYETLSHEKGPIFNLLKAKCPVIAQNLDVKVGDTVIKHARD